jgi:hypothetical protein
MAKHLLSAAALISVLCLFSACEYTKSTSPLGPSPTSGAGGRPCVGSNPEALLTCVRAQFGQMDSAQLVEFLKATAFTFNRNGVAGGPYGVLRKESGNQCSGYSCDIICAGEGTAQRQYDVLLDAEGQQEVSWGPPATWPDIRVDRCEIP